MDSDVQIDSIFIISEHMSLIVIGTVRWKKRLLEEVLYAM
jgi:hypothetical protein